MIDQGWRWYVDYLMFINRLRKFALPMSYLLQKVVVYHFPAQMGESRPRGHYPPTPPLCTRCLRKGKEVRIVAMQKFHLYAQISLYMKCLTGIYIAFAD